MQFYTIMLFLVILECKNHNEEDKRGKINQFNDILYSIHCGKKDLISENIICILTNMGDYN